MLKLLLLIIFISISADVFPQAFQIRIKCSDGVTYDTLRLGYDPTATNGIDQHLGEFELPPLPPSGIFDVRLFSDSANVQLGQGVKRDYRPGLPPENLISFHKLRYQRSSASTYFRLSILPYYDPALKVTINFRDAVTGTIINETFADSDTGSIVITNPALNVLVVRLTANTTVNIFENFTEQAIPGDIELHQNYPNPFNPVTSIPFKILRAGEVKMKLFDAGGRLELEMFNEFREKGDYTYRLDCSHLSAGVYFYTLEMSDIVLTRSFVLLK